MSNGGGKKPRNDPAPTRVAEIDRLADLSSVTIQDYVSGVSAYVRQGSTRAAGPKKAAQIRLSNALAGSLADELSSHLPKLKGRLVTHEQKIAGGLRTANADISESHPLDGLRLAIELKPINLAVGRAIWNRFGDIRTFAVNIHLKFPFAVVGGVLVIPTYEETGTKAARKAEQAEEIEAEHPDPELIEELKKAEVETVEPEPPFPLRKSTFHLIERAIERLLRAGGRKSEAEAAHLLEGIAVVVYDPATGEIHSDLPKAGCGLRWDEFVHALVTSYRARFARLKVLRHPKRPAPR
jgi:hypothetical protein